MSKLFYSCILLLILCGSTVAQSHPAATKLKLFIEGSIPDFNYLRNNMPFVDFVNDPRSSDLHIMVTQENTGSGGRHYYINFNPITVETVGVFTLNCITSFQDTQDDIRSKFTGTIKTGTLLFINEKQLPYRLNVTGNQQLATNQQSITATDDPWNNWVYTLGLEGGLNAEEQKQQVDYEGVVEANRVTNTWRFRNEYSFGRRETFIKNIDGDKVERIHAFTQQQEFKSRLAYSLTSHWSAGFYLESYQITHRNIEFSAIFKGAIEYNVYPWEEYNRHSLTIAYTAGPMYYDYYKPTVFNQTAEWLGLESLKVRLQKIEPWGELEVWLNAEHYLPNFEFYALKAGSEFSIRVAKGLFVEFEVELEKINNQLYLQAEELSDEEVFLNTRKLPTSFEFSTEIGLQYRFGSMYNNVVNNRL